MQGQAIERDAVMEPARGWWALGARSVRVEPGDRFEPDADEGFAFVVAHDLKQPLQGIRAYCELLQDDYEDQLDAEGRRRLNVLIKLCDRLSGSISGLLRFCRSGEVTPSDDEVDLNALVDDLLDAIRPLLDARRGLVEIVDRLPAAACDATLVGEVLANLISNGLKFNESERPRVEIGFLPGDPPVFYVRDNGIGIPEEHHDEVFGMFRRLHARDRYEGTGAGLAIVRKIVESHGGRIWIESEPGEGTTFFFTLAPGVRDSHEAQSPTQPPHWASRSARFV